MLYFPPLNFICGHWSPENILILHIAHYLLYCVTICANVTWLFFFAIHVTERARQHEIVRRGSVACIVSMWRTDHLCSMSPLTGSKFPSADTLVYSLLNLPISSYLDQVLKSTPNMWQDAISEITTCDIYTNLRVLYSWFRCVALAPINSIEWPMNDRYKQSPCLSPLHCSIKSFVPLSPLH